MNNPKETDVYVIYCGYNHIRIKVLNEQYFVFIRIQKDASDGYPRIDHEYLKRITQCESHPDLCIDDWINKYITVKVRYDNVTFISIFQIINERTEYYVECEKIAYDYYEWN